MPNSISAIASIVHTTWWPPSGGWAGLRLFTLAIATQTKNYTKTYVDDIIIIVILFQNTGGHNSQVI